MDFTVNSGDFAGHHFEIQSVLLSIKGLSQNRRGLAHFAESAEQNVPVPFSGTCR